MTTPTDLPNGYYSVPPGKLANAVTWLEMLERPVAVIAEPLQLVQVTEAERVDCHELFAAVGTPWLWSSAFEGRDRVLEHTFFALNDAEIRVGIVEFSIQATAGVEITYFGLVPTATGAGLGRRMMAAALEHAWRTAGRVWLHTCNFDHPGALRFYLACGFTPFASGFEIMDDPRLDGSLPHDVAPHVPLIKSPPRPA